VRYRAAKSAAPLAVLRPFSRHSTAETAICATLKSVIGTIWQESSPKLEQVSMFQSTGIRQAAAYAASGRVPVIRFQHVRHASYFQNFTIQRTLNTVLTIRFPPGRSPRHLITPSPCHRSRSPSVAVVVHHRRHRRLAQPANAHRLVSVSATPAPQVRLQFTQPPVRTSINGRRHFRADQPAPRHTFVPRLAGLTPSYAGCPSIIRHASSSARPR